MEILIIFKAQLRLNFPKVNPAVKNFGKLEAATADFCNHSHHIDAVGLAIKSTSYDLTLFICGINRKEKPLSSQRIPYFELSERSHSSIFG